MSGTFDMVVKLSPELDTGAMRKLVETLKSQLSSAFSTGASNTYRPQATTMGSTDQQSTSQKIDEIQSRIAHLISQREALAGEADEKTKADGLAKVESELKEANKILKDLLKKKAEEDADDQKKRMKVLSTTSSAVSQVSSLLKGFTKQALGFLEDIYNRLKSASPLLQAIESLFQMAMTLFFMPLGNKLGEILLPAVLNLLDKVVEIWGAFENQSLGEMFATAISEGVKMLGEFFTEIGGYLVDQGGLLGKIGSLFQRLGSFIEEHGEALLSTLIDLSVWIVTHIPEIVSTLIGLEVTKIGLMITQIATTAAASAWWTFGIGAGTVAAAGVGATALAGAGVGAGVYSMIGMSEGGMVPATPGGQLRILGEGGEDEFVFPRSKLDSLGSTTNNFYISGVTSQELGDMIDDRVNRQISGSRLRSGF